MATAFDGWLRQLSAAGKGGSALSLTDIPPATRGLAWSMPVRFAGDWSAGTIAGTIRAAPDAATALATISFTAGSYDSGTGFTTWTASLASGTSADSTGVLPADTDGDGIEVFPMAIYLTPSGGSQELLFGGIFTLLGKA